MKRGIVFNGNERNPPACTTPSSCIDVKDIFISSSHPAVDALGRRLLLSAGDLMLKL
jgi:hypothetical protein